MTFAIVQESVITQSLTLTFNILRQNMTKTYFIYVISDTYRSTCENKKGEYTIIERTKEKAKQNT